MNDEEVQVIGWVSKNVPRNSKFLVDRHNFLNRLDKIAFCSPYIITSEITMALKKSGVGNIFYYADSNCSIGILEGLNNQSNILKLNDQNKEGKVNFQYIFNSTQQYGQISFLLKTTNSSKNLGIKFTSTNNSEVIFLLLNSKFIQYYNGSHYNILSNIENDIWYEFKLFFESGTGNFSGLFQYHWKISINNTDYGNFEFLNSINHINQIRIFTDIVDSGWEIFFNNLSFSWVPDVKNCFYTAPIIINYLKLNDITYYIYSLDENPSKIRSEQMSLNINYELLSNYFTKKIYQYQNLAVFNAT